MWFGLGMRLVLGLVGRFEIWFGVFDSVGSWDGFGRFAFGLCYGWFGWTVTNFGILWFVDCCGLVVFGFAYSWVLLLSF